MKERILKNREELERNKDKKDDNAKGAAMAVLAPTLAPPKEKEESVPGEDKRQSRFDKAKAAREAKIAAAKEKAAEKAK